MCMYVCYYVCLYACVCVLVYGSLCACIYIRAYIYYMFFTYGVFCYVMGGEEGGTVVSVYSFCILYVLLFDDFLQ